MKNGKSKYEYFDQIGLFLVGLVLGCMLYWVVGYVGFFVLFVLFYGSDVPNWLSNIIIFGGFYGLLAAIGIIGMRKAPRAKAIFAGILAFTIVAALVPGSCSIYNLAPS
jgi:hypothetical protein